MRAVSVMTSTLGLRLLWLLVGWLMAMGAQAASPDQVVFGPQKYTSTSSSEHTFTAGFSIPAQVVAPYVIHIVNGSADGANRISSARVSLNGIQIAGPNDFGNDVAVIERTVSVLPNNTLEIKVSSTPGNFIDITVFGTWPDPVPVSITPDPLNVYAGAAANASVTLAPTPRNSGSLALSSDNPAVAAVPGSVGFAANQANVVVPVSGVAPGNAAITASLNGTSATGTIQVTKAPPTISSMLPNALTVTQGGHGSVTVTLSAAQDYPVQVSLASSAPNVAGIYPSITIPVGQSSASFQVFAYSPGAATITAQLNGTSAVSQIDVTPAPAAVVSLQPATSTVTLGANALMDLTISSAQPNSTVVNLSASPEGLITIPASVIVSAGEVSVPMTISTLALGTAGITASLNGSSMASAVYVTPPSLAVQALTPSPLTLAQDASGKLTVALNAAQPNNTELLISSNNPGVLRLPATVTVPAGKTEAFFTVTGLAAGDATVTITVNGTAQSTLVHVGAYSTMPVSLVPETLGLQQGATGSLLLNINAAQSADVAIPLTNTSPDIVQAPMQAIVPAGATAAVIPVTGLAPGFATVTAALNGASISSNIEVNPPPPSVTELFPAQLNLPRGVPGKLRVTVSRAPAVPTLVQLASNNPSVAEVPAITIIPAGALSADFPVFARGEGAAGISASLNGGSAATQVTVTAPELVALTLSPQTHTAYVGETVSFTAQATYTDGTQQDLTSEVTWSSSDTTVASIASGAATALAIGSSTIAAASGSISTSTVLNVQEPPALTLSPASGSVKVGDTLTLSVASAVPAGDNGVLVALTVSGTGGANAPANVTIPADQNAATFNLTGTAVGDITITASAPQHITATAAYSVLPMISISSLNPSSGPVGSPVTISGSNFSPDAAGNEVRFNGERAIVASATANEIKVIVPVKAKTGLVTVTTAAGTATSPAPYTVKAQQDFDIVLTPESVQAPLGGTAATRVKLVSTGLVTYAHAAQVSVAGLPAGVTAQMERASVYVNGDTSLVINVPSGAPSGTHNLTVTATGQTETGTASVSKPLVLEILAAGATTVSGRVMHAEDDSPFVGARIRLGDQAVFTDASGYYRFVSPTVLGDQVIKIDGHTAAGNGFEYPSAIAMPVMIEAGKNNVALTSYIQAVDVNKYTTIVPGQKTSVTDPDIPNYSLNIPEGAVLYGWDGTPVTKVNIRTVPVDRLPIKPVPEGVFAKTVYLYYFFREGGANPTQPIPVTMVNDFGALPGEKVDLWYYDESTTPDPNSNQWRIMGQGTVSDDGLSIVSDPGVGIPKFCCGATFPSPPPPPPCPSCPKGPGSSDSIDYGTGIENPMRDHSIGLPGAFNLKLSIGYNSRTDRLSLFGRGTTFTTEWQLIPSGQTLALVSPQGHRYLLGKGTDGVYRTLAGRNGAYGIEATPNGSSYNVRFPQGDVYEFISYGGRVTTRILASMTDPAGNRTVIKRANDTWTPLSITDPQGQMYQFQYAGGGDLITRIDGPQGRYMTFAYDGESRVTAITDHAGRTTQYAWNSANRIISKTFPNGGINRYEYDASGRAIKETLADGAVSDIAYLVSGGQVMETTVTDSKGSRTQYRFNGLGDLTRTTDALGRVSSRKLDNARNLVLAETDPAGRITEYIYDVNANRTHVKDALGNLTITEYDLAINKPLKVTNALGQATLMQYDVKGNLTKLTNAENQSTTFTYTSRGQLQTITDPLGNITRMEYDEQGNLTQTIDAAGRIVSRHSYDNANRLSKAVNALGNTTQYSYDTLDRLTEITDAANGFTRYAWDSVGNLARVDDPNGNPVERNSYDLRNRLIKRTDAGDRNHAWEYDLNGNLIRQTDRNGQVTHYVYDALNRVSQITDADGRTTSYEYDLAGNVAAIRDSQSGDLLYNYDALSRVTKVVSDQGTVEYQYDALGRRVQRTVNGGDPVTYQYDKANRITQIGFRGKTTSYIYDAAGRLIEQTLPNDIKLIVSYDATGRVLQMQYLKPQ